ncbi:DUF4240 domain-containing protein [Nonomuraea antimicrobica]
MDIAQFWMLIERARDQVPDADDDQAVASTATALLSARPAAEIVAAQQAFWDVMAASYRAPLWGAAYLINGGCSDDGFDYFRGWLVTQGREVFERVVADPDTLAELPVVRAAAAEGGDLDCEEMLGIAWRAHLQATGEQLPPPPSPSATPPSTPPGASTSATAPRSPAACPGSAPSTSRDTPHGGAEGRPGRPSGFSVIAEKPGRNP